MVATNPSRRCLYRSYRGGDQSVCSLPQSFSLLCSLFDSASLVFTGFSFAIGNAVSARQKSWLQATEKRINFTTSILGSIRNVKVLGLTQVMSSMIEGLRTEELEISKKFRKLQSIRVCMDVCFDLSSKSTILCYQAHYELTLT